MKSRILIVEDNPLERDVLKEYIEKEGWEAICADTGEEGLKKIKEGQIDLVIIDTVLPGIDGFEVCRAIKGMSLKPPPKIIVTTGKIDVVDIGKARNYGADDYMVKTSDFSLLLSSIRKLLKKGGKRKVLIVEDSPTALEMMKNVLETEGYEVAGAVNGKEGVAKAKTEAPDLIIIDTVLPDTDGFEVCRKIRGAASAKSCRIIITTGKVDAVDAGKARVVGADDYIVKTSDFSYLLEAVMNLI